VRIRHALCFPGIPLSISPDFPIEGEVDDELVQAIHSWTTPGNERGTPSSPAVVL
jgi:hypothetical protein